MSDQIVEMPGTVESPIVAEITAAVAVATAQVAAKASALRKFAEANDPDANRYGIVNDRGQLVTNAYLSRYIQCWCRIPDGFVENRKQNFAWFMSDEFLSQHVGSTASKVGHAASQSDRWGSHNQKGRPSGAGKTFVPLAEAPQPVAAEQQVPTADAGGESITPPQPVAEPEPIVELIAIVGDQEVKFIDLPANAKPAKRKSKKEIVELEQAELAAAKPAMIEALAETIA